MHDAYNIAEACVAPLVRDWYAEQLTAASTECRSARTATAQSEVTYRAQSRNLFQPKRTTAFDKVAQTSKLQLYLLHQHSSCDGQDDSCRNFLGTLEIGQENTRPCLSVAVLMRSATDEWYMRCTRQTALERKELSRMYLAHHELASVDIISILLNGI